MIVFKAVLGKLIIFLISIVSKLLGKKRGTTLPGKIMLKVDENLPKKFKGLNYSNVFVVTGTNGKSSTVNMLVHGLKSSGYRVVSNLEGANLTSGITTTLLQACSIYGKLDADYFVFEADERYLKNILDLIPAKNLVVTNIQKDQVQRNGDPDYIVRKIRNAIKSDMTLYLNNDEPRTKALGECADKVVYFGINKHEQSFIKTGFLDVTLPCPKCSSRLSFEHYNLDNVGRYSCKSCGFAPNITENMIDSIDFENQEFMMYGQVFHMPYTESFMLYNYSLTVALLSDLGISNDKIASSLSTFVNQKGRTETFKYKDKEIHYIRIKQENPETLQSSFDVVAEDESKKVLLLGLMTVVDFIPHYTNTFYAYDCNVEKLLDSNIEKIICFGKPIAYDVANRFTFEKNSEKVKVLYTDDAEEIFGELDKYDVSQVYLITWLKSFFEMKKFINDMNE